MSSFLLGKDGAVGDHTKWCFDGLESITVRAFNGSGEPDDCGILQRTPVDIAVANCLRREVNEQLAIDSGASVRIGDALWEVWVTELPDGFTPDESMKVIEGKGTSDERVFSILGVDDSTLDSRFRIFGRV